MQKVQEGLVGHGYAVFTHEQTAGRGQRGKSWHTNTGENIALSVLLNTAHWPLHQQFYLSALVAVAVRDFFASMAGSSVSIKWPNDIYCQDKKAGGILIENSIRGQEWKWAIVGIGLNINQSQFPEHLPNAISLQQITARQFDVVSLAKQLCNTLQQFWEKAQAEGFTSFIKQYNQHLFKLHQAVRFKKDNTSFTCTIKGVNEQGDLLVEGGLYSYFSFGEVEWVL
jgi:BirA family biotin operon repressor/biotin-[acetyl-CoA-carboxylase] ligase